MRLFGRRGRFPRDMVARLEMMGRYEMDAMTSGIDGGKIAELCIIPHLSEAPADPEGFTADLRDVVAGDTGGFATYGASRLVWELLSSNCRTPGALDLLDAAIAFKRTLGLPTARLRGYEMDRWLETRGQDAW